MSECFETESQEVLLTSNTEHIWSFTIFDGTIQYNYYLTKFESILTEKQVFKKNIFRFVWIIDRNAVGIMTEIMKTYFNYKLNMYYLFH